MPEPIKRHKNLQPISREHHHGLLLSWKIRQGIAKNISYTRIKAYCDWFWENHLQQHFDFEERNIFPLLDKDMPMVKRVLKEHRRLRRLFQSDNKIEQNLSLIEEELVSHIRFEERTVFKEIEKTVSEKELALIEQAHSDIGKHATTTWEDEFWT
ncbi:MAG: hemerythrin domain-containing protein [Saprospiraceae bacterium]|nr:hemerythrin domain-containing protein [Saprospiraceae bacterium]